MIHEHRHLLDILTWACAGVSVTLTLAQVASVVAIAAGIASLILFALKLYDRFTCGSWNGPGR
jgi:hypothetical protein